MTPKDKKDTIREKIKIGDLTYLKEGYGPRARKAIFEKELTGKSIDAVANKFMIKEMKKVYI